MIESIADFLGFKPTRLEQGVGLKQIGELNRSKSRLLALVIDEEDPYSGYEIFIRKDETMKGEARLWFRNLLKITPYLGPDSNNLIAKIEEIKNLNKRKDFKSILAKVKYILNNNNFSMDYYIFRWSCYEKIKSLFKLNKIK